MKHVSPHTEQPDTYVSGLTLVEMLVLTITLCIVSISIVLLLSQYREQARNAIRLNDLVSLEDAIHHYQSEREDDFSPIDNNVELFSSFLVPAYLPVLPVDPGMNSYVYIRNEGNKTEFTLGALDEMNSTAETPVFFQRGNGNFSFGETSVDGDPSTEPQSGIEFGFRIKKQRN